MTGKPISLMSGFKDIGKNGASKGIIRVQCDDLIFDPNDRALAQAVADAMLIEIKVNLQQGKAPDGQALPGIAAATVKRRAVEAAQGARGGEAHPRFHDAKFTAGVEKRYDRDYNARQGGGFTPEAGKPRGEVSGLLIESMSARGDKNGKGVSIYVAAKRGRPRPSTTNRPQETKSALESVLAGAPMCSPTLMEAPKIKQALSKTLKSLIGKPSEVKHAFKELFKELKETVAVADEIADEVKETGEGG